MKTQTFVRSAVALGLVLAVVGCAKAAPTKGPVVVASTPRATPTAEITAEPTPSPTASSIASPTASSTASPTAKASAKARATAVATSTATPTSTATATAAGSGLACTGTAEHLAFFVEAANALTFNIYCAVLPSSWWLSAIEYRQPDGGYLTISYKNLSGGVITVGEGNFCAGVATCWASASDLGTASFGDKSGLLKQLSGGQYAVFVDPGTASGYQITGKGMSQADFVAMAAAMVKVPKS
jgi:hypothetical protein